MPITKTMLRYFCHHSFRNRTNILLNYVKSNIFLKSQRNLHSSMFLRRKMFLEHENQYAYNVMENKGYVVNFSEKSLNSRTNDLTVEEFHQLLHEDWSNKPASILFETFSKLGVYSTKNNLCISNKEFDSFIDSLTDKIKLATDNELRSLFYYLLQWPETDSIRTRNFIEVWAALDDVCWSRLNRWTYDEILTFISLFYMLNVTKASDYCMKSIQKLVGKAKNLTSNQMVQTLFFIGIIRTAPHDMHNLEIHLDKLFETFSIDELAIMSMGFFKSKTPIRSMDLISKICDKVIEESKKIHEVSLAALLKVIRYSGKATTHAKIYKILDTFKDEVPRLSVMCNVHLALLGTATLTLHKEVLNKIAISTIDTIDQTRLKDLERLVLTFGIFNFVPNTPTCFLQNVVEELRKQERIPEIEKHGRSFACCVSFLAYLGIYPIDLMSRVLSPEFLTNVYGKQCLNYGREVLAVHNSTKIFCPEDHMHSLSDKCAILLAKKYTDFVPSEDYIKQYNVSEKIILEIIKILQAARGGKEFVTGDHIVTHHQRGDVIICNNQDGLPMDVKKHFDSAQFGKVRKVPDNNIWIALIIGGRNAVINNTDTPTGPFLTKIRELRTLGFHAGLVLGTKFSSLESKEAKANYLNNIINNAINDKTEYKINKMQVKTEKKYIKNSVMGAIKSALK